MNFNKKKYIENGFFIIKKIITKNDISKFFNEIKKINKIYNYKSFDKLFKNPKYRSILYKKLQNLNSVRIITEKILKKVENSKIYKKMDFKVPTISNGLIISLPHENDNLNPLHQDIYNFSSFNFIKVWLPLTRVNKKNGSMEIFKSSNKLGYIKPKFNPENSTYPEVDLKYTKGFQSIVFDLDAGDCVFFNPLILHRSLKNCSKKTRFNIGIDIQDFKINGNSKIIDEMKKIKDKRTQNRSIRNNNK